MDWARILAYVTGTVDQELLARNEYLAVENRILKEQLNGRPRLSDAKAQIAPVQHPSRLRDRWISGPFPPPLPPVLTEYSIRAGARSEIR
jgi:hypothetical protein